MRIIRLNEGHRAFLNRLATDSVKCAPEEKADKIAYDKAAPLVRHLVEDRYPPREMKMLTKYEVATRDECVKLQLTAGGVVQFTFRDEKSAPLRPATYSCERRIYQCGNEETDAVQASLSAMAAHKKALDKKLSDYRALIAASATLEQVEQVWPAASALRARVGRSLPVVLSDAVIARIKADVSASAGEGR